MQSTHLHAHNTILSIAPGFGGTLTFSCFGYLVLVIETLSCCVAQAGFKFAVPLVFLPPFLKS